MKSLIRFLGAVLALASTVPHASAAEPETQTALIGFAGPLSWPLTQSGQYAAQLAVSEANRIPLVIDGKKIVFKLLAMDDKAEPMVARFVAKSLAQANVVGVIGHWTSAPTSAAAELYNDAGVAHISPSAAAPDFTQKGYATSFRSIGSSDDAASAVSRFIVEELKSRRIAILDDASFFGTRLADFMEHKMKENNIQIIARETTSNKTSDFNAVLTDFSRMQADLIFFSGYLQRSEDLVRTRQRLNIRTQLFITGSAVNQAFLALTPGASEGVMGTAPGRPYATLPEFKRFEKNFHATYQTDISSYTLTSYDATNTLIAAIRLARSLDRKKVIAALHKVRHKGLLGTVAFDDKGNLLHAAYTIYRVQQQQWFALKSYE